MKRVNLLDQLISYYCLQVQCRSYWLSMFIHGLDVICVNLYVVASWEGGTASQKQFLVEWIEALTGSSNAEKYKAFSQSQTAVLMLSLKHFGRKRTRMSHTKPELPRKRHCENINGHKYITDPEKKQQLCEMCC